MVHCVLLEKGINPEFRKPEYALQMASFISQSTATLYLKSSFSKKLTPYMLHIGAEMAGRDTTRNYTELQAFLFQEGKGDYELLMF